jgi:hypothetical protein
VAALQDPVSACAVPAVVPQEVENAALEAAL